MADNARFLKIDVTVEDPEGALKVTPHLEFFVRARPESLQCRNGLNYLYEISDFLKPYVEYGDKLLVSFEFYKRPSYNPCFVPERKSFLGSYVAIPVNGASVGFQLFDGIHVFIDGVLDDVLDDRGFTFCDMED